MRGDEVRSSFLEFFESRGHLVVPSAPLVPRADPTLMFTNAGMVPFKDIFLGNTEAPAPRVVDSQKCLRISGKHNDLEEVGRDTYHHTLFEMLGNWSFGDYYKAEAIEWAWELLVGTWGLPADKLYATVYRDDAEAEKLWKKISGLPSDRVQRFDEKDNFWEMGETGPCGPCSEIHIDRGEGACDMQQVPGHKCEVNAGCARYIELWNLVFIQYNRDDTGQLHDLPMRHVDTGMGLERVAAVLENVDNNYDGTLLRGLVARAEQMSGLDYGKDLEHDVSMRVLADHARAVSFMLADGIEPSNEGRGYVLRRLLRRAARHGRSLELEGTFFARVCESVIEGMGAAYPELNDRREAIVAGVEEEELRFSLTLDRGLAHLDEAAGQLSAGGSSLRLDGETAFRLYDTYGFPLDMTQDILRSRGIEVDVDGFKAALEQQRERARAARRQGAAEVDLTRMVALAREKGGSSFEGSWQLQAESEVIALGKAGAPVGRATAGDEVEVVTAVTPFYAESGGQVGDTGFMSTSAGTTLEVLDTRKGATDVSVHVARVVEGELSLGDTVSLGVDEERRQAIRLNHSVTHLLHAALRHHLGDDTHQAGSLVDAARLRFDFKHDGPVAAELLAAIEREVNDAIRDNLEVTVAEMSYDDALATGALAFFGEKYGDLVRVVRMGDYSVELCGGTHVARTGDIGLLRLAGESGVAAGVRRVEAVSGAGALGALQTRDELLSTVAGLLRGGVDEVVGKLEKLLEAKGELEGRLSEQSRARSGDAVENARAAAREVAGGHAVVARADGLDAAGLREMADRLRAGLDSVVVVLAGDTGSGVAVVAATSGALAERVHAGNLIKELAPLVDGRGGGKPDFAQAGGKDPGGLDKLLEKANELVG
ncbi:MAG: alanine--tRNA ligase [Proteobacteria bacterium]|nr:alanine--tRNA ligase [Pseudomonadota bacterium]